MADLLRIGADLDISLTTTCSSNCLRIEKQSKKGSHGKVLSCTICLRSFHVKCMESEKVLTKGLKAKDLLKITFACSGCGGSASTNRVSVPGSAGEDCEGPTSGSGSKKKGKGK